MLSTGRKRSTNRMKGEKKRGGIKGREASDSERRKSNLEEKLLAFNTVLSFRTRKDNFKSWGGKMIDSLDTETAEEVDADIKEDLFCGQRRKGIGGELMIHVFHFATDCLGVEPPWDQGGRLLAYRKS